MTRRTLFTFVAALIPSLAFGIDSAQWWRKSQDLEKQREALDKERPQFLLDREPYRFTRLNRKKGELIPAALVTRDGTLNILSPGCAGPSAWFTPDEALRLADWIQKTFGGKP